MIFLDGVSKSYRTPRGDKVILQDVEFNFDWGGNIGILGQNGAGKSTLMRLIAGLEAPDAGRIDRDGLISWPIGFSGGFKPDLSGEENVCFVAKIFNVDPDYCSAFCQDFAEIGDYFFAPIKQYSSGMRARLAFAMTMAIDFDVYLVDEVIAVGDRNFQEKCHHAFQERAERSMLIMVSHKATTLRRFCTRAAVLSDGGLTQYASLDEAIEEHGWD